MSTMSLSNRGRQEVKELIDVIDATNTSFASIAPLNPFPSPPGNCSVALKQIWTLCEDDEYKELLIHPSFHLLPSLKNLFEALKNIDHTHHEVELIRKNATGILWYLSRHPICREPIGSSELQLLPFLLQLGRKNPPTSDYQDHIICLLSNLCLESRIHDYLLTSDFYFFEFLWEEIHRRPNYYQLYKILAGFTKNTKNHCIERLILSDLHTFVFTTLINASTVNAKEWEGGTNGVLSWCLSFVNALSSLPAGAQAIRKLNTSSQFFFQLMHQSSMQGVEASMIIGKVYGKDESSSSPSSSSSSSSSSHHAILTTHPSLLTVILDLFDLTLNYNESSSFARKYRAWGFVYGLLQLRDITTTLKCLSISDENKKMMIQSSRIVPLTIQCLQSFLNNSEEYSFVITGAFRHIATAGGGGEDYDTMENCLELLVQLSFYYEEEDEEALLKFFTIPSVNIQTLLKNFLNLPKERNLPFEAKKYASTLLNRLQQSSIEEERNESSYQVHPPLLERSASSMELQRIKSMAPVFPSTTQHIMLSYSWGKNKPFVIALGKRLRAMGYDIWRDEEGSSILPPMSGDIVEAMAQAIQLSYMVIICVSPQYKESVNCRAEAKYARTRAQGKGLKLAFVMMDEHYHTHSTQPVDGWLGFMVGTDLWYPLWQNDHIESTAMALAELIGDHAKYTITESPLTLLETSSFVQPSLTSSTVVKVKEEQLPSSPIVKTVEQNIRIIPPLPDSPPSMSPIITATKHLLHEQPTEREQLPDIDYELAWECLQPKKSKNPAALAALLDELGVYSLIDLKGLDREYYESIAILLKPAPQKNFRMAVKLI